MGLLHYLVRRTKGVVGSTAQSVGEASSKSKRRAARAAREARRKGTWMSEVTAKDAPYGDRRTKDM